MATVTSITSDKVVEISDPIIIDATFLGSDLVLIKNNGSQVNLGEVAVGLPATSPSIATLSAFDKTAEDVVIPDWFTPGMVNPRLSISGTYTSDRGRGVAWSPEGLYLASPLNASPWMIIWKRRIDDNDNWNFITNPTSHPTGLPGNPAFSPDGQYLAFPHEVTPFITIYKRTFMSDIFTKLANPVTLPAGAGLSVSWSPDGTYLAMGMSVYPSLIIYKRSGDVFTKLADPLPVPPTGVIQSVSFAPNGVHLAIVGNLSPYAWVYRRTDDVFNRISHAPSVEFVLNSDLPTGDTKSVGWSVDSYYLAMAHSNSPFVTIYKRNGDTFIKLANPDVLPAADSSGVAWSPDMQYLIVTFSTTSPYHIIYKRTEDVFRKIPDLNVALAGDGGPVAWSPDGVHLAVCHTNSPYTSIYQSSFGLPGGIAVKPTMYP